MGKFGKATVSDVQSAIFINAGTIVSGSLDGSLLVWDLSGKASSFGTCIQVSHVIWGGRGKASKGFLEHAADDPTLPTLIRTHIIPLQVITAHGPGVKAPSIHNGVPVLQGVRALCLRANNTELCSGGSDGIVLCWDLAGGTVGRVVKKIEVGQDCGFDSQGLVIGTPFLYLPTYCPSCKRSGRALRAHSARWTTGLGVMTLLPGPTDARYGRSTKRCGHTVINDLSLAFDMTLQCLSALDAAGSFLSPSDP